MRRNRLEEQAHIFLLASITTLSPIPAHASCAREKGCLMMRMRLGIQDKHTECEREIIIIIILISGEAKKRGRERERRNGKRGKENDEAAAAAEEEEDLAYWAIVFL